MDGEVNPGLVMEEFEIKGAKVNSAYLFDDWRYGKVQLKSENTFKADLRYDALNQVLEVKPENQVLICNPNRLVNFEYYAGRDTVRFVNVDQFEPSKELDFTTGIFEILYGKDDLRLAKTTEYRIKKPDYNPALNYGSIDEEIKVVNDYYKIFKGQYTQLDISKRKIPEFFIPFQEEVRALIKREKLNPKRNIEDLEPIFSYYDKLIK